MDKVNAELVTLTYGTIVAQLCRDFDNRYDEVNKQLDKMGYNIGMRLIEDFMAKANTGRCTTFREIAETVSRVRHMPSITQRNTVTDPTSVILRLVSRCFLTLYLQSQMWQLMAIPSPSYSKRIHWQTLWSCQMMAKRRASCGILISFVAC